MTLWSNFIDAVNQHQFEFAWQKPLIVAQAILESGRGTSSLATDHLNFNGMKYRESIAKYGGRPFRYYTETESTGSAIFFEFDSLYVSIETWKHRFEMNENGWIPYPKVLERDPSIFKSAQAFIEYIGPIYCPYWNKPDHDGLSYAEYITQKCYPEAEKLLEKACTGPQFPGELSLGAKGEAVIVLQSRLNECGYSCGRADGILGNKTQDSVLKFQLAQGLPTTGVVDERVWSALMQTTPRSTRRKVLLDPGHSERHPGARNHNGRVQEEDLNRLQAQIIKAELQKSGITADIYDQPQDDLMDIGRRAKDYDMFISLHHNACDGKEHYTCAMVHQRFAKQSSYQFASSCAQKVATALNNKLFQQGDGVPPGVYPAGLSVLNGAENSGCKGPCVLTESYFVDAYNDQAVAEERSRKAAIAIAAATREWLVTHA